MSTIRYNKIDFSTITSPDAGDVIVGYDLDGLYKQKDENGIITIILNEFSLKTINSESLIGVGDIVIPTISDLILKSNINSPVFTGVPSGPTASLGTNTTQFATTAFVLANTPSFNFITNITYSALKTLYDGGTMTVGYYRISDFATIYTRPDFDAGGAPKAAIDLLTITAPIEPIIVFATSSTILSEEAFQELYPKDKIKYDITFDTTDVKGDPAKGRISERIDEFGNRTEYDHRNVIFKRYETAAASGIFTVINDNGEASDLFSTFIGGLKSYNILGDFIFYAQLVFGSTYPILSNNVFSAPGGVGSNIFAVITFNNTVFLSATFANNKFGIFTSGNIFTGSNMGENTAGGNFQTNVFSFGNYLSNNKFNVNFIDNVFTGPGNIIDNEFNNVTQDNIITSDEFKNNYINSDFKNNVIGNNFQSNTIGTQFENCTIGNGFSFNIIGNGCTIACGNNFSENNIGSCNISTGDDFTLNTVGGASNVIAGNFCSKNNIGNDNSITFSDNAVSNEIKNQNTTIIFGSGCQNNKIGINNSNLTLPANSLDNEFVSFNSGIQFVSPLTNNKFGKSVLTNQDFTLATHVYASYFTISEIMSDSNVGLVFMDPSNGLGTAPVTVNS